MNLAQKLITVYKTIEFIEKRGFNKSQNYKYMKASDIVTAVRRALLDQGVYAEINMFFDGPNYTIARAKDKDAPFSAVNTRCVAIFHDTDSNEILTASGLGTGADTGDKASYKSQTGAIKYMLRNAFLIPDEEGDPESDPELDEGSDPSLPVDDMPDFHEAQHVAPRANTPKETPAAAPAKVAPPKAEIPTERPTAAPTSNSVPVAGGQSKKASASNVAAPNTAAAPAPSTPVDEPAADGTMPTEEQMTGYRQAFKRVGDDLSTEGKLKSSAKLPVERKLLVFLLSITSATDAKKITRAQWDNFFSRVETAKSNPEVGFTGLAKLVNKANGIEEKK